MTDSFSIDTTKTALVVVDLQKGIVAGATEPYASADVVKNAAALAAAFRAKKMPVFLVRVTPSADGKDGLSPSVDEAMKRGVRSADWADIVPEMQQTPEDFVITKRQWGAFYGTELDLQLRRRNVQTVVLCGISTNVGVESTARDAYERGYQQIFAEDATAARSAEEHVHAMQGIFKRIGRVRSTEEILRALK
ncbi:MAG: hydrolase [Candidatus Paceibacterota bacterium]|jgi:nicotinamidase-related amidase